VRVDWFVYLLIGLAVGFGFTGKAYACSCQEGPRDKDFEASAAVFEGQVIALDPGVNAVGHPGQIRRVDLKVVRTWKGANTEQVAVFTPISGSECGYAFQVGKSYLIYAIEVKESQLAVSACGRTREISKAGSDIDAMGMGSVPVKAELTAAEKKSYNDPALRRPIRQAGCAGCEIGSTSYAFPRTGSLGWLALSFLFCYWWRRFRSA
jgi:hypothetical protein